MLTNSELAQLRSDLLDLLPDTCDIQTATLTTTAAGNTTESWATTAAGVKCRLDPMTRRQDSKGMVAEREALRVQYILTLPFDASIALSDRIVHNATTYEIVMLHGEHSLRAVKRVTVSLIQGS